MTGRSSAEIPSYLPRLPLGLNYYYGQKCPFAPSDLKLAPRALSFPETISWLGTLKAHHKSKAKIKSGTPPRTTFWYLSKRNSVKTIPGTPISDRRRRRGLIVLKTTERPKRSNKDTLSLSRVLLRSLTISVSVPYLGLKPDWNGSTKSVSSIFAT